MYSGIRPLRLLQDFEGHQPLPSHRPSANNGGTTAFSMGAHLLAVAAALLLLPTGSGAAAVERQQPPWEGSVDFTRLGAPYMGLGGLSGGGGTSRLLYDYPPAQREQVLDALFAPKRGGNLQILKVLLLCAVVLLCCCALALRCLLADDCLPPVRNRGRRSEHGGHGGVAHAHEGRPQL
jgi:hypothetical protein